MALTSGPRPALIAAKSAGDSAMARFPKIQITVGEVTDVQLTSERVTPNALAGDPSKEGLVVTNMRVFLKDSKAKERNFDFEGAHLGVRQGHEAVVVRGRRRDMERAVNLMLVNQSTNEREEYQRGFDALYRKPFFGPRWKALGLSVIMFVFGVGLSHFVISTDRSLNYAITWSLFFSFLAYPVFWAATALWDRITQDRRRKAERERIRREVAGRLKVDLPPLAQRD